MKKFLLFILFAVVVVVFVILFGQSPEKAQRGIVLEVDTNERTLLVKTEEKEINLFLTHHTKIVDAKNTPTFLGDINKGFEVKIDFHLEDDVYFADQIKIISAPNIVILYPKNNEEVGQSFLVSGIAKTFENTVIIEVVNPRTKQVLIKKVLTADAAEIGHFGDFETNIDLSLFPYASELTVSGFQISAKDGSVIDKTSVGVKVIEPEIVQKEYTIFFADKEGAHSGDCSQVLAAKRISDYTVDILNNAINDLIKGPLENEEKTAINNIPEGTQINSIFVDNNILKVDFNEKLQEGIGGSCMVISIMSQLEETLNSLGDFENIIISINGQTEDVLQP